MNPRLVRLSRAEAATARQTVRKLEPSAAARALGLSSPVTLFRALALYPVHPLTAETIRAKLPRRL